MKPNNFGQHLTVDLGGCISDLTKTDVIFDFLLELATNISMTPITLPYVIKWLDKGTTIEGVSGFVIIAESHISIHTYPEKKELYADVFSCRNFNVNRAIDLFTKVFQPKTIEKNIVKRGITPSLKTAS
jgi:S-adenosylmethionine decarboxylase